MESVFITGANKSIGFQTARQLLHKGYHVYLGSRTLENGLKAVEGLNAEGLNEVEAVQIDVRDRESVRAARAEIGKKIDVLDVLINNAGINGGMQTATDTVYQEVFDVNLFGVVRVTRAFMDLLQASSHPRIINVSSAVGSLTLQNDPTWKYYGHKLAAYDSSKAALNMYTVDLAYELRNTSFKVNAVDPGFVATDFNYHRGTGAVEEGGMRVARIAMMDANSPTGTFMSEEYNPETGKIPW